MRVHTHTHTSVHVHTSECTRMHTFPCACAHAFLHTTRPNHLKHLDSKCTCAQDCPGAGANTISLRRVAYSFIACLAALYIQKSSCLNECTSWPYPPHLFLLSSVASPRRQANGSALAGQPSHEGYAMSCKALKTHAVLLYRDFTLHFQLPAGTIFNAPNVTSRG